MKWTKIKKLIFLAVIFLNGYRPAAAQEWNIQFKAFPHLAYQNNFDAGWSGAALAVSHILVLGERSGFESGLEVGYAPWGNQVLLTFGYDYMAPIGTGKWTFFLNAQTQQGIALTRPTLLYSGGLQARTGIGYLLSRRFLLALQTGLRFSFVPAYDRYSEINRYLHVPLELHLRFVNFRREWPGHY
mgnify:CR=1 FL=1